MMKFGKRSSLSHRMESLYQPLVAKAIVVSDKTSFGFLFLFKYRLLPQHVIWKRVKGKELSSH